MEDKKYIFIETEDFDPHNIPEQRVYVDRHIEQAYLRCPCGCGHIFVLGLDENVDRTIPLAQRRRPTWSVRGNTIEPSVHYQDGCLSHFRITDGAVTWWP